MDSPASLLAVDDNEITREVMVRLLTSKGLAVDSAGDGNECLAKLNEGVFDAVLLDINMPGMSGFDVIAEIRGTWPMNKLPVIFVTAMTDPDDIVKGLEAGANDYITKPINASVLYARLGAVLKMKKGIEALVEAERQRAMFASATAAVHHLAQPLTKVTLALSFLAKELKNERPNDSAKLEEVLGWTQEVGALLTKLRETTEYRTIPYTHDIEMLDIGVNPYGGA